MQTTSHILMIRPASFGFNPQTAESNVFQHSDNTYESDVQALALREFDAMAEALRNLGVDVMVVPDTPEPHTPDAVFPNNWVSFHRDGAVCLYPMQAPNRRLERRTDIIDKLRDRFTVSRIVDLSYHEAENRFLEGTGSLVFDRISRIAYACLSPRTDEGLLREFEEKVGFRVFPFTATDEQGVPIYHTNVLMTIGDRFAVVCLECIRNETERTALYRMLEETGREVITISLDQVYRFAGNMLQIQNRRGEPLLVMSTQAYRALLPDQIRRLEKYNHMIYNDISTIERVGGGSARCMIAEILLPEKGA